MLELVLFKNSGIQFFGHEKLRLKRPDDSLDREFNDSIRYTFERKWLPISFNGQRNLLMVMPIHTGGANYDLLFSMDTNIYSNDALHTVHEDDSLFVFKKWADYNEVTFPDATKRYIEELVNNPSKSSKFNQTDFDSGASFVDEYDKALSIYKKLVYRITTETSFKLHISEKNSHEFQDSNKVSLILDLGNTRSIGLLLERDNNNNAKIQELSPLMLIDYNRLTKDEEIIEHKGKDHYADQESGVRYLLKYMNSEYNEYLISSQIKFRKPIFSKYHYYQDGEEMIPNFHYPTVTSFGAEAMDLNVKSDLSSDCVGLSGPKRYLWSTDTKENTFWHFADGDKLDHKVFEYIDLEDKIYAEDQTFLGVPTKAVYPKSTMMIHGMMEIIYQAYCQINSEHYRKRVGEYKRQRVLDHIYLSFPTGMPIWERKVLVEQSQKALDILVRMKNIRLNDNGVYLDLLDKYKESQMPAIIKPKKMMGFWEKKNKKSNSSNQLSQQEKSNLILNDIKAHKKKYMPKIELGFDEATSTQLAFLYGESFKLKHNIGLLFKFFGLNHSLRIASLDIGGGTSDLAINDFVLTNPEEKDAPFLDKKYVFADGVYKAGDDIVKKVIEKVVLKKFIETANNKLEVKEKLQRYFGENAPSAEKSSRLEVLNGLLLPLTYFYFLCMEKNKDESFRHLFSECETLNKFNSILADNKIPQIEEKCFDYLESKDICTRAEFAQYFTSVPDMNELENAVQEVLMPIFLSYSRILDAHRPSFLLVTGRISSIPYITNLLSKYLPLSNDRIISLNNHYIGNWYPFRNHKGQIKDPKTSVVVGNAIGFATEKCSTSKFKFTQSTDIQRAPFKINYLGISRDNEIEEMIYNRFENNDDENFISKEFRLFGTRNILHKKVDNKQFLSNLIYHIKYKPNIIPSNNPKSIVKVKFDCKDIENELKLDNITGKVVVDGSEQNVNSEHIKISRRTMLEEEYYLDKAEFIIES